MFNKISSIIGIILFVFSNISFAKIEAQHTTSTSFAPVLANTPQAMKEVGKARFSIFIWDVYESRLLTDSGNYESDIQQDLRYEITYLRDISSKELIKRTIEQWQHLGFQQQSYTDYLPALTASWPDIRAGDKLTLLVKDNKSAFYHNLKLTHVIESQQFAPLFLDIWLSKYTSQPKLRAALLGGENG